MLFVLLTMSFSRRLFLAGSACVAASTLRAAPPSGEVDVAIIGAGAAGIAAARRITAFNRSFALIEANAVAGERCLTDTRIFGVPFDIGARWIYLPDSNPVAKLAIQDGMAIYLAPRGQRIRIGRRYASESELEDFQSKFTACKRAIQDWRKADQSCAQVLPPKLGDWHPLIDFLLGPFSCGKDVDEVSAIDFSKAADRDVSAFCTIGFGTLLAKLAAPIPVELATPARRIYWAGQPGVQIETPRGLIKARSAIVTVSTGVLSSDKIKFIPDLPKRQQDAISKLKLGNYEHIALELPGNPLGLASDNLIYEKCKSTRTAAILGNVSGTPLCVVEVGGKFGRELALRGAETMADFAIDWLADLYGSEVRKLVRRVSVTGWHDDPSALGSFSAAAVGGQPSRRILMEPLNNRLWFAGEAAHETLWGTVGGAWESGERAATEALRRLGVMVAAPNPSFAPGIPQAPVGHRQPRPSDMPPNTQTNTRAPLRELPAVCDKC
jgi:monoamine oxidase